MAEVFMGHDHPSSQREGNRSADETSLKVVGGTSSVAALCGLGAVVLAILGLSGVMPDGMCAIAALAAGAALILQGGAIAGRFHDVQSAAATQAGHRAEQEVEGGMTAEMVGGIAAVVLGILSLIHIAPLVLLPVSVIVLGATLLLGSGAQKQITEMPAPDMHSYQDYHNAHRAANSAAGADVLIGLGAVTLGILSLTGVGGHDSLALPLVGMLCVGGAELLSGSVLGTRMGAMFHQHHH